MVRIKNNGEPQVVPLAYYDEHGARHVIGETAVQIKDGEIIAVGQLSARGQEMIFTGALDLDGLSMSLGPYRAPSPAEKASARLGVLGHTRTNLAYVTPKNPDGEVRQCTQRDLHAAHEYYDEPGTIFAVYCPGNTGSER